jgi:hypothetical protein
MLTTCARGALAESRRPMALDRTTDPLTGIAFLVAAAISGRNMFAAALGPPSHRAGAQSTTPAEFGLSGARASARLSV